MKNMKLEAIENILNKRPNKIKLIKNYDSEGKSSTIFNSSCNNLPQVNSISYRLINNKGNNKLSQFSKNNNQSSIMSNSTIIDSKNTNKGNYTITSYMNKKTNICLNKNKNCNINSSFCLIDEESKNKDKKSVNKSMYDLYQNIKIKNFNKNLIFYRDRDIPSSFRSNINNKREEYKRGYSRKRTEKEIQNRINQMNKNSFGKINKYEKKSKNYINNQNKHIKDIEKNKNKDDRDEQRNRFNQIKNLRKLRKKNVDNLSVKKANEKNSNKNNSNANNIININNVNKEPKNYTNLYDKYIDKFMEKIKKLSTYKNYHDEKDQKYNNNKIINKNNRNKSIIKPHNFQRALTCKKIETKNKKRDISKAEALREKTDKRNYRKVGKSIGDNTNINKSNKSNLSRSKSKNSMNIKENKKRSKSMVKITDDIETIKNEENETDGIDDVLYGKFDDKEEMPVEDVNSAVRAMDFKSIKLFSKNIFSVEFNDKYKKYSEKFEKIFNKIVMINNQRKSVNNNKNNENDNYINISNAQSEKTTDSFKKNKINISFIDNQNNSNKN